MATLKAWYPLTKDYKDYSGNSSDLELVVGSGSLTEQPGLLGRSIAQTSIAKTTFLRNDRCGLKDSHAMFCFLKVTAVANTSTANGIMGCHSHSAMTGTGITLKPLNATQYRLSVNTASGTARTFNVYASNRILTINEWYHVGFTWDEENNILRLYIDGVLDNTFTTVPDMAMVPSDEFCMFVWSIAYTSSGSYRPAFAIQDVRVYSDVPSLSTIQRASRGLFFHVPLDAPCEGSRQIYSGWESYTPYNTVLESRHDYVKTVMVRDGTLALKPNIQLTSGKNYRVSGYCFKNGQPIAVSTPTTYSSNRLSFNEPETGWFSMTFTATGVWPIHAGTGFGSPGNGDIYEFTDLAVEDLTDQQPITSVVSDASGMGHHCVTDKHSPSFKPLDSPIGRGSCYFEDQYLRTQDSIPREGNTVTALMWAKGTAAGVGNYHTLLNFGGTKLELDIGNNHLRVGVFVDGVRKAFNTPTVLLDDEWHLVGLTYDGQSLKAYRDGVKIGELSASGTLTDFDDNPLLGRLTYPTSSYASNQLLQSDARIYGTALSEEEIKSLYTDRFSFNKGGEFLTKAINGNSDTVSLTRSGVLNASNLIEGNYKPSLIDYSTWNIGSTSATGFSRNGSSSETVIVTGEGPHGIEDVLWEASNNDASSDADGGWNGSSVPVDKDKLYRLSVWIRRKVQGNGTWYFGTRGYNSSGGTALENFSSVSQSNPYFGAGGAINNDWLLFVGYIFPAGSSEETLDQGIFTEEGVKVGSVRSFRFTDSTKRIIHRTYLYYSTNASTVQQWYRPRIDLVDGNEPSFEELLYCSEHTPLLPLYKNNVYPGNNYSFGDTVMASEFKELK